MRGALIRAFIIGALGLPLCIGVCVFVIWAISTSIDFIANLLYIKSELIYGLLAIMFIGGVLNVGLFIERSCRRWRNEFIQDD
jgi:hypothetical protein